MAILLHIVICDSSGGRLDLDLGGTTTCDLGLTVAEAVEVLRRALEASPSVDALPDLVTLDAAAALVHRKKRALEYYKTHPKKRLPMPTIEGGGGQADFWDWPTIKPWLESTFNVRLPVKFPAGRES
jgi:hypothetical protein